MAKVEGKARQSAVLWTKGHGRRPLSQDGTNTAGGRAPFGARYLPSGVRTPTQASRIC